MRIAWRSVPLFGSVSARPPRISPVANFGSHSRFCASVPKRVTAADMMRCELKMPDSDIQTADTRSEEHTSELQSLMRNSYAVFCLQKKKTHMYVKQYKTQIFQT